MQFSEKSRLQDGAGAANRSGNLLCRVRSSQSQAAIRETVQQVIVPMQNPQNQFLAELTQLFGDIDEMIPQFTAFADHHAGLAEVGQFALHPALGVVAGSVQFILNDINRAREGDVLAVLQSCSFLDRDIDSHLHLHRKPCAPASRERGLAQRSIQAIAGQIFGPLTVKGHRTMGTLAVNWEVSRRKVRSWLWHATDIRSPSTALNVNAP